MIYKAKVYFEKRGKALSILKTKPAVFAVGNMYQIMVPVESESLLWIKCGNTCYYDEINGVLRSGCLVHKVCVPMEELDNVGEYTVYCRKIIKRKAYFTESEEPYQESFKFHPVSTNKKKILAYQIGDAHNHVDGPAAAAKRFEEEYGKIDFLVLNGDIPDHSGTIENFDTIYKIADRITGGEIPIIFARGNHDLRGSFAEKLTDYTPNENGNTYFTVRLGNIWALVLDCGEDKADDNCEYAHTVSCSPFRKRETEYLKSLIKHPDEHYMAPGISHRLVIAHFPFTQISPEPFNIENEIYGEWTRVLENEIKPDLMMCAHMHDFGIHSSDSQNNRFEHSFTVVIGSKVILGSEPYFAGMGLLLQGEKTEIVFNDDKEILSAKNID